MGSNPPDYRAGHRQRLRQRFLQGGAKAVADYEVLELLLFASHPRGDVKPLARRLLDAFGSSGKVLAATPEALATIEGMGEASVAAIKVAELAAQRLLRQKIENKPVLSNWTSLLDYCTAMIGGRQTEAFHILFLNTKNELIADEQQQTGTINHAPVYPREVMTRALHLGAANIILIHNHPTGDPTPSAADITVTRQIIQAGLGMGIKVYDHVIIGHDRHYSFKSEGLI